MRGFAIPCVLCTGLLGGLAACRVVGTDYHAPVVGVPDAWRGGDARTYAPTSVDTASWWRRFDDPVLSGLVERAASANLDVRAAVLRVNEARALRGIAAADWYPTVDGTLSYGRRAESENTPFGGFVPDSDTFTVGLDAAWEIDLFGRVKRSVEAADADLQATTLEARDVGVSVAAEVALRYIDLRAFQRRLAIARENVSLQEQTLALVKGRFDAGLVGERDVAQARSNVETTRSRLPAFELGVRTAENRLAVLLGRNPGALELGPERAIPVPPVTIAVGVPADLLRRRADVRRAERALAAEHARIGVAEGDLYPRLTLTGEIGFAADEARDVLDTPSLYYGYGPSLRWNLFDSGRLKNRVRAQEARTEQAFVRWEHAVLVALEETENALTSFVRESERRSSLLAAAGEARRAAALTRDQYAQGLIDFQTVLASERSVSDLEDELATSDAAVASDVVVLYKALGGAWNEDEPAVAGSSVR